MTTLIKFRGAIAGFAGGTRFYPAPHIAALPNGDPVKRFVVFMWLYDQEVRAARLPGEYSDESAELFARCALIDDDEFARRSSSATSERDLADLFQVPFEQIAAKRADLARLGTG